MRRNRLIEGLIHSQGITIDTTLNGFDADFEVEIIDTELLNNGLVYFFKAPTFKRSTISFFSASHKIAISSFALSFKSKLNYICLLVEPVGRPPLTLLTII